MALNSIQECLNLPKIKVIEEPVYRFSSNGQRIPVPGVFRYNQRTYRPIEIAINSRLDYALDWPLMSLVHETAHYIDFHAGRSFQNWYSETSAGDAWYQSVLACNPNRDLRKTLRDWAAAHSYVIVEQDVVDDSMLRREIFAQVFVFFAAFRSGNSALLAEINRFGNNVHERAHFHYWGIVPYDANAFDASFENICLEIERILIGV